jgi:arylsulfatase A-like enzyme
MGCSGNPDVKTPALDQLARQGIRLTQHIANSPVCGPNRATLLTGRYAHNTGAPGNDLSIRTDLPSLGTLAKQNGYNTGYIGKWHLDGLPRDCFTPSGPRRLGFDFWAAYNCRHRYFQTRYFLDTPVPQTPEGYEPEIQTDLALNYLEKQKDSGKPFCLVLSWSPPHDPYDQVPSQFKEMYNPGEITLPPNIREDPDNIFARKLTPRETFCNYYAAITALDKQMGRLLAKLETLEMAEDTLVIFTSDHGDLLWAHGWMKKQAPYEESIHIPFIARLPGVLDNGTTNDTLLGTVDILPTVCGLLNWKIPDSIEGRDLSAALTKAPNADSPTSCFIANYIDADEAHLQNIPVWRGVRTRQHTYAEKAGRTPWLLFDNKKDPFQTRNLLKDPEYQSIIQQLQNDLSHWITKTNDCPQDVSTFLDHVGLTEAWDERERTIAW